MINSCPGSPDGASGPDPDDRDRDQRSGGTRPCRQGRQTACQGHAHQLALVADLCQGNEDEGRQGNGK